MNANAIQAGHEYAYTEYPSRNKSYYPGASRVRVLNVYKGLERQHYNRSLTLVEAVRLDENGNVDTNWRLITAPARQFVAPWHEHLVEKARYDEEQEKRREHWRKIDEQRQERYAREEAERQRRESERQLKELTLRQSVADSLDIDVRHVHLNGSSYLLIERRALEGIESRRGSQTSTIGTSSTG